MMNDPAPELSRRKRAAWGAFKNIEGVVKKTKNIRLRAHLFDTALHQRTKIRDAVDYAKKSKIRWAGHVMRYSDDRWTTAVTDWIPRDVKRTQGRPPMESIRWTTLARDRDEWRRYWRPLEEIDDQRDDR
ncbi:hypothetical protein V3C99_018574 [Haemonchus contortus]